jgi:hypothetical protein
LLNKQLNELWLPTAGRHARRAHLMPNSLPGKFDEAFCSFSTEKWPTENLPHQQQPLPASRST